MSLLLYRVDDRLIHGQVVIGWGRPLGAEFIVLVDDLVAASDWEQDLYRMGVPPDMQVIFADVATAVRDLPGWQHDSRKGILLTADIATMAALRTASGAVEQINLGGIHHRPGRTARLPYVYLTDDEYRILEALETGGARVTAQDVPTGTPIELKALP
jgi:PTS system mannose-specific IIB component/fructoselysine and glucoselysine-specific PTS system IIB component